MGGSLHRQCISLMLKAGLVFVRKASALLRTASPTVLQILPYWKPLIGWHPFGAQRHSRRAPTSRGARRQFVGHLQRSIRG